MKTLLSIFFMLLSLSLISQSEAQYSRLINQTLGGQLEYRVTSGRVDILTEKYAIEVEFARKWKQAIGQALWYGLQTNKQSGIVLIVESSSDYKYFNQLNSALRYAGLEGNIEVWLYPNDFKSLSSYQVAPETVSTNGLYWITTSSKVRHNSKCSYFGSTRGKYCSSSDGRACRKCGG